MAKAIKVYQIDSDVPVPGDLKDRTEPIPISKLEPGQSILFPAERRQAVQAYASKLKARRGKVFTIQKVDDNNARIWRVE